MENLWEIVMTLFITLGAMGFVFGIDSNKRIAELEKEIKRLDKKFTDKDNDI